MRKSLLCLLFFISVRAFSQSDSTTWVRAFPITNYQVELSDSIKLVQVYLPGSSLIKEKQIGLLRGTYKDKHSDTSMIGLGRCNLIKGDYYYFTINNKKSGLTPKENDLLYTIVDRPKTYINKIVRLASHFIILQNVYETELYDPYVVNLKWTKEDEDAILDSMVNDIHFTGDYFLKNNPSMNIAVKGGKYKGKMVLNTMISSTRQDLEDFLSYMIARPRLYAGRKWKISETYATWLSEGAPTPR